MSEKIVILTSKEDIASMNIRDHLLKMRDWKEIGIFDKNPALGSGPFTMILINEIHLYFDNIGRKVSRQLGFEPELIVVASRHKSQMGLRTLTVHPLGNWGNADFGGKPGTLVPTAPREMTHAHNLLKKKARHLDFKVTFEATHHGPYLKTPLFFIEIGSDENAWYEKEPAKIIADVILSLDRSSSETKPILTADDIICIGIGGGHYMPRISEVAETHKMSFGHMIPGYALEHIDEAMIRQAMKKTPGVSHVYFHRKGMSKPRHRELRSLCEEIGLMPVSSKDVEER